MKTEPNDSAFSKPSSQYKNPANGTTVTDESAAGLTKLEYFAGLAMQGLLANPAFVPALNTANAETGEDRQEIIARCALQNAIAMIAALNNPDAP